MYELGVRCTVLVTLLRQMISATAYPIGEIAAPLPYRPGAGFMGLGRAFSNVHRKGIEGMERVWIYGCVETVRFTREVLLDNGPRNGPLSSLEHFSFPHFPHPSTSGSTSNHMGITKCFCSFANAFATSMLIFSVNPLNSSSLTGIALSPLLCTAKRLK